MNRKYRNKKRILALLIGIAILVFLVYIAMNLRDWRMTSKCTTAISLVEEYRNQNGTLPKSLSEVGFKNSDGSDEIYYDILNDSVYSVSYMYSMDFNKFYYSDTQTWHNGVR